VERAVERDTSPDVLEDASELSAVERDVSPERREDASDVTAVPTDVTMEVIVTWKLASSLRAAANSLRVSRAAGAPSIRFVIAVLISTEIFVEREASPEALEETSDESAVERDTSPDALEDTSEDNAVERDASALARSDASALSMLISEEVSLSILAERDTSPEAREEASELRAVERDTSPDAREEASEEIAVERDVSADTEPICWTFPPTIMYTLLLYTHNAPLDTSPSPSWESIVPRNSSPFA